MRHLWLASVAVVMVPATAWADEGSEPQVEAVSESQPAVGDIVVTAQRRSESLQKVPLAISAVTGETLARANITKAADLAAVVPSLQSQGGLGPYTLFFLRGIGTFTGNTLSDSPVAFNYNGVYIGQSAGTSGFFYDIERVEVLKGPQGTLYGRNATGGAINLLPTSAKLGETSGYLNLAAGNYSALHVDGAVNLPLGEKAAVRAAGYSSRHDGYLNDGTNDQKDYGGRLSLLAEPSANLRIKLVGDFSHSGGLSGGAVVPAMGAGNFYGLGSPQSQAFFALQPNFVAGRTMRPLSSAPVFQDNDAQGVAATVDWITPIGTVTVIPAYRHTHNNYLSNTQGIYVGENMRFKQTSLETRLTSGSSSPISYLLGGYYFRQNGKNELYINAGTLVSEQKFSAITESVAAFGQLGWEFAPDVKLTAGARYTHDKKTFDATNVTDVRLCLGAVNPPFSGTCPNFSFLPLGPLPSLTYPPGSNNAIPVFDFVEGTGLFGATINNNRAQTYSKFTYKIGLSWQATANNFLYADYSTGYKSGGFFFSNDSGTYKPENIKAWAIGVKNRLLDGKLQLNIDGFYYTYSNLQVSHIMQDSKGFTVFGTDNVGKASIKGFEVEAQARPTQGLMLSAGVQYLDSRYDEFQYSLPVAYVPTTTCGVAAGAAIATIDCSGKRLLNAPVWTITGGAEQTIPLSEQHSLIISARMHFQANTNVGLEFVPEEQQKAYAIVDLSARLSFNNDRFSLEGFVNNLTNRAVITNAVIVEDSNFPVATMKPPRVYGVRVGMKF